jgi:hypothetical protein
MSKDPVYADFPLPGDRNLRKIIENPSSDAVHHADAVRHADAPRNNNSEERDNRPVRCAGQRSQTIVGFGTKLSRR